MDRRTLLFVFSLSLTLLAVNLFFERQNQGEVKEWQEQQRAKKSRVIEALKEEISQRTVKAKELPLKEIRDEKGLFLNQGALINGSLLTLSWEKQLPKTVQVEGETYTLVYSPSEIYSPALYEKKKESLLRIGELPYFGHYDLQIVTFFPGNEKKSPVITLGDYSDGKLTIPAQKLQKLEKEIGEITSQIPLPGQALVFMKTPDGYLPVASFQPETQSLTFLEQIEGLLTEIKQPLVPESGKTKESYYVLENSTQQCVFSNIGGALIEINLPFEGDNHPESVVKEIEFDRDIDENHPYNAHFPSMPYLLPGKNLKDPFIEHPKGKIGGYYPLLRRNLFQKENRPSTRVLPEYYALNIVSEYPEMAELVYRVTHFDQNTIVFEATQRNRKITKTFSLDPKAPYIIHLTIKIDGDSRGLWLTSGVPEAEWISNALAPALKYRITRKGKPEVISIDVPKETTTISSIYPDWICNSNGFFGLIIDPLSTIEPGLRAQMVTTVASRLVNIDDAHERFKAQDLPGYLMLLPLNNKGGTMKFRIFAGPFASDTLSTVDTIFSDPTTGYNPDYFGSQTFHGWFAFISAPFAKFLFILMRFFHAVTGSWGFSIILLTVALRIMLYPLNAWSTKSMLRMQQISPEVQRVQEKYKNDPKKAQLEVMNIYRTAGVNPISGCFPLLIQLPFLIGMFDLLKSTFELRGASFIPGWIDNLAAPDVLFSWNTPIWFIGNQFHLLPILLGVVMFLQQQMMSGGKKASEMTDQQRQQRAIGTIMTAVFAVMFYHFPSGLNIYWLSSMLLGILQQWWMQKRLKKAPIVLPAETTPTKQKRK